MKQYIISIFAILVVIVINACGTYSQIKSVNPDNEIKIYFGRFLISEDFIKVKAEGNWRTFKSDDGRTLYFDSRKSEMGGGSLVPLAADIAGAFWGANTNFHAAAGPHPPPFKPAIYSLETGRTLFESMWFKYYIIRDGSKYKKVNVLRFQLDSGMKPGYITYHIVYTEKTDDFNSFKENSELVKLIGFVYDKQ